MPDPSTAHDRLIIQLRALPPKPPDTAKQAKKKAYSEQVSRVVAFAVAAELRKCGLDSARPTEGGLDTKSGAERRMAGGIGAKKVDVTWATEESGLLVAFSIKSINFKDSKTKNYQKNLTNRRGDLLFESITLHRRFPYAVLVGLFLLDEGAKTDRTDTRKSTLENAHDRLDLFTGRSDPAGRDEQYEHLYIGLLGVGRGKTPPTCQFYLVRERDSQLTLDNIIDVTLRTIATRNADMYTYVNGRLESLRKPKRARRGQQSVEQDDDSGDV
jgi:hypothetical protein